MLYISSTMSTTVNVTLYEKTSNLVDPHYTWRIVNSGTNQETVFTAFNYSGSPYYQSFTLSVSSTPGLTNGTFNVQPGQYVYQIYETQTPDVLILVGDEPLIETGILNIVGPESSLVQYDGESPNYIVAYGKI